MAAILLIIGLGVGALVAYAAGSVSNTPKVPAADVSEISSLQNQVASWQANATALQLQLTRLDNQTSLDDKQISSLQANATSAMAQVASLQSMITVDNNQISALQSANSTGYSQIESLEANATADASKITILNAAVENVEANVAGLTTELEGDTVTINVYASELHDLQAPFVSGNFTETASCPISGNCSYSINGVYANFGMIAANNATLSLTFYSGPSLTGQTLCTTTIALGSIPGRTSAAIPQATCASSSSTQSQSFGWTFTHS